MYQKPAPLLVGLQGDPGWGTSPGGMASPSPLWCLPCDLGGMLVQASLEQSKFQDQKVMVWLPVPKIWSDLEGASPCSFSPAGLAVYLSFIPRLPTRLRAYVSVSLPLLPLFLPLSSSLLPSCFFISLWLPSAFEDMEEVVLQTCASVSHLCVLMLTCIPLADLGPESSEQGPCIPYWTQEDPTMVLLEFRKQGTERDGI